MVINRGFGQKDTTEPKMAQLQELKGIKTKFPKDSKKNCQVEVSFPTDYNKP